MNRFIMADSGKCIGCHTCEVACVIAHHEDNLKGISQESFSPRIHVVKNYRISTVVVCRQCEDAPCATVCPNEAISRKEAFIFVDQQKCIGCKTCVVACPYGTMDVVTHPLAQKSGILNDVPRLQVEAYKCDLCYTKTNGPACVDACPTDALVVMDQKYMKEIMKNKRRRSAFDIIFPF